MAEMQLNLTHRTRLAEMQGARFNGGGKLHIRSGARPGANAGATGTLLVPITLPATAFSGIGTGGTVFKGGTWAAEVAATGAPGHFRLISSNDEEVREGDAGVTDETMVLSGLVEGDLIEGGTLTVTSYTITQAEGSPDPV